MKLVGVKVEDPEDETKLRQFGVVTPEHKSQ